MVVTLLQPKESSDTADVDSTSIIAKPDPPIGQPPSDRWQTWTADAIAQFLSSDPAFFAVAFRIGNAEELVVVVTIVRGVANRSSALPVGLALLRS